MIHTGKLEALRRLMIQQHIDAYIIPSADPHISEYVPEHYRCVAWASGFTGSAGTLVITQDFAGLWTDSRYFVQAAGQLAGTGFELVKLKVQTAAEYADWLAENLPSGAVAAYDGRLASVAVAGAIRDALLPMGVTVKGDVDLLTSLWRERPPLPREPAFLLDEAATGESVDAKLSRLRSELQRSGITANLISSLDDVAWLFNIRGSDVPCNPVVLAFALVTSDDATLFIEPSKLAAADRERLAVSGVHTMPYGAVYDAVSGLPGGCRLLIDPKRTCAALYNQIPSPVTIIERTNPTTHFKAVKNATEIEHTRATMIRDGVALTRFFRWLEASVGLEALTEISVAERLRVFRSEQEGFIGESFDTIAGYQAHGALPHYKATPESDSVLRPEGLFLLDSGGQYRTGTTDITRVVPLGPVSDDQRVDYTLVLRAMIEGSTAVFPKGTRGYQIDAVTRKPLWDHLRNYGHGTGHGVGFFLNVHEGPHTFNAAPVDVAIEPGTITSIEPGLYREGAYGIRIENLVLTVPHQPTTFGDFLAFETLTLCHIETRLIDRSLLEQRHIDWLNAYHRRVYEQLSPYLDEDERHWLAAKTEAI